MQAMRRLLVTLVAPVFVVVGTSLRNRPAGYRPTNQSATPPLYRHAQSAHSPHTVAAGVKGRLWIIRVCDGYQHQFRCPPRL